ncbi:MAG: translation initiation factor Sui1 [Pseudomonadota bacterium]|jgi:translation initiation factor 1|nr:translation initiation factor Sui1 [Pseudomonadota bacterium]
MAGLREQLSGLVYSTDSGQHCPECGMAKAQCRCEQLREAERLATLDGVVRIRRETKGRKGKGVTTISGLPLPGAELKRLAKTLKERCGTGGAIKAGVIEIQGDHRERLQQILQAQGYTVKLSGG